jgi:hypothetical protein
VCACVRREAKETAGSLVRARTRNCLAHCFLTRGWMLLLSLGVGGGAGLVVVCPRSPRQAKGLLLASIRRRDPVIFFEPKALSLPLPPSVSPSPSLCLPLSLNFANSHRL